MKKLVYDTIRRLERASVQFADVRLTSVDEQDIRFERGMLKRFGSRADSQALGVRVLVNGCWGFAGTDRLNKAAVARAVETAIRSAEHGSRFKREKITFASLPPVTGSYFYVPKEDPFLMDDEEKIAYMGNIAKLLTGHEQIVQSDVQATFYRQYKIYANTEGTFVDSLVYDTNADISVLASDGKQVMNRTWPGHMAARRGGFETIRAHGFEENSRRIVQEARDLLHAPTITEERADIIIGGGHLALQLHESVGHATEADRIFGMEISYAGKTFIKPAMLGSFRYGSDAVTIYSDSANPEGLGYHIVDDEGVPGHREDIIRKGILVGQQTSREIAPRLGLPASSNMKATRADDFPLVRMTNFCLAPGQGSLADLIAATEHGYLVDFTKTWSIDDNRYNFQFTTEIGWKIEEGRITGIVREPTYYGITPEFWGSCDRVCGPQEWLHHGTYHCGKGEPGQSMHLSHGVAPARFRNVVVNVKA